MRGSLALVQTLGFVGSGNIARALAIGLGDRALFSDGGSGRAGVLAAELDGSVVASNAELVAQADVIVLAHKPAQLAHVARELQGARTVLSLLGGIAIADVEAALPGATVTRAMPNTAVALRKGVTCVCGAEGLDELLARVGLVMRLPERLIDAATAVSGVAPAYVALIAEAWVDAAVAQGIPADQAATLVGAAISGAAAVLEARGMDTLAVRREVTSPGGMTARGLRVLERAGLRSAFSDAAAAVVGSAR